MLFDDFGKDLYREGNDLTPSSTAIDPDRIDNGSILSSIAQSVGTLQNGKTDFTNTEEGYILGVDNGVVKFYIGDTTNYLNWDGSTLTIAGSVSIGAGGTIGGFDVGADYVRDVANSFGLASTVTVGDDVRFWAGDTFANRGSAPFRVTEAGAVTATNMTLTGGSVGASVSVALGALNVAARGWSQTCVFSVTDADTVAWAAGSFISADGTTYSINSGNTGNMAAATYIYLDTAVSTTAYQTTTTAATAVGAGKVLIAKAQNGTGEATFETFGGIGGINLNASSIVANSITANELSTSITYAGSIIIDSAGLIRSGQTAYSTGTGWWLGNDGGTPKFSIGDGGTSQYMEWDGTTLNLSGTDASTVVNRSNTLFTKMMMLGDANDNMTTSGSVTRRALVTLTSGNTTPAYFYGDISTSSLSSSNPITFGKDMEVVVYACIPSLPASGGGTNSHAFIGLSDSTAIVGAAFARTNEHIGFQFYESSGVKVRTTNANGSTQTTTDITSNGYFIGGNSTTFYTLRFVWDSGTNIKYYINDSLVATHSTNLPTGTGTIYFIVGGAATSAGGTTDVFVSNNYTTIVTV